MPALLLVEDDPAQQILYGDELRDEGYTVFVAKNGPEAIEKAQSVQPAVVVLDIGLSGMDGLGVLQALLTNDDCQKVVINTAYARYRNEFMSWAADGYVVKSSSVEELKQTIRNVLAPEPASQLQLGDRAGTYDN